ncbi:MAG: SAM-dependent methyltransferase [Pseudomonadota bacterium]|nr:SAM-dependent methyltransferase [Pseudomonadota bacterium]
MRPPFIAIALLSGTALSYEILLIRLFSIIQWHHFAYMVISLSLLGYGASGAFLTLAGKRFSHHFPAVFMTNALLFAISSVAGFLCVQQIPFNPLEMAWGSHQLFYLLLLYLLLSVPFFAVANCIGLTLVSFTKNIPRIYSCDLLGAGLGALAIIILLFLVSPVTALYIIGSAGLLSAAVAMFECRIQPRWIVALLLFSGLSLPFVLHQWSPLLQLSPYKSLRQTLAVVGTEIVAERSSPLGFLTVVQSPVIPFRQAPGLSLNAPCEPPAQLAVFTDGEGLSVITENDNRQDSFTYMDYLTSALPYHLLSRPSVLVLGAGGGADVLQARYFAADRIDAVELNPQVADLVKHTFKDFAGDLYRAENIHLHIDEARSFVAGGKRKYDLIQLALLDAFSASSAGLYALSESYVYTTEALIEYIDHLHPNGLLAITRWIKLPPRDALKLFATAVAALEEMGVQEPGRRLILIRSWKTSTLLIKNGMLTPQDIRELQKFCQKRSFDLAYYPGIGVAEANRYNLLDRPYFFAGTAAILDREQREDFFSRYKFNLKPATDDRPYFFHFFKWSSLAELLSLRAKGGLPLLEQGYLLLIVTLIQAIPASLLFILLPLWFGGTIVGHRRPTPSHATSIRSERWWVVTYFFSLGIAFLFIEIAFIQKFILFLGHPLYAVGVVIAGFLLFAGWGSNFCSRQPSLHLPVAGITIIALLYLNLLPTIFHHLLRLPDPLKIFISLGLIAPLAFCMGMPFPLGLTRLTNRAPELLPWAWGINGCASVISAILATLGATHFGFSAVVIFAVGFYILAAVVYPREI